MDERPITQIPPPGQDRKGPPSEKLTDYRQLNVWKKAHKLVLDVYSITKKFPKDEKSELVSRMRETAMTIPVKIAEGFMWRSPKDKHRSYKMGQEALEELKYTLLLSKELGYIKSEEAIVMATEEVGRMLTGLVRSVRG